MGSSLSALFKRDLNKLKSEISKYENEDDLWVIGDDILNSAGTLCLHICGSLQHFIGAVVGNSGYERNRPYEFSARDIPREKLLEEVDATIDIVTKTLDNLSAENLASPYPIMVWDFEMTHEFYLINIYSHTMWHLGHINYHRRLLANR